LPVKCHSDPDRISFASSGVACPHIVVGQYAEDETGERHEGRRQAHHHPGPVRDRNDDCAADHN
jgi:hypothetical protein